MRNTDIRVSEEKPVTPAFLAAALLWPVVRVHFEQGMKRGMKNTLALQQAMYEAVEMQTQRVLIPRRISVPMRDIWSFQLRLERRSGKRPLRLLTHPRFRAAFDFLQLRAMSGESTEISELSDWWQQFQSANSKDRQGTVNQNKKRTIRKRRSRHPDKRI